MTTLPPRLRLSLEQLDSLRAMGTREDRSAGVLMQEGWPSDHLLLLAKGIVKITSTTQDGASKVLALRGPNELVGDFGCIDGAPRSGTVVALTEISAWRISAGRFRELLRSDSELCYTVLRLTVERVRESDRKIGVFGDVSALDRVVRLLADLAAGIAYGTDATDVCVPVDQTELGNSAGVSRATVSRTLHALAEEGLVRQGRGQIVVTDLPRLMEKAL